jgi:flagellar P-ring protein FlgI
MIATLRSLAIAALLTTSVLVPAPSVEAQTRIKDIVEFEGVRDNMLIGYGLVVGLNGTGDTIRNSPFTEQSLTGMLERLGVNVRGSSLRTRNVAAVMVTGKLGPFAAAGTRMDINVATLGDATSLQGGQLLVTPLLGADGEIYAVGQGTIAVSGFVAQGQGATVTRGVPTSGRIAGGAIIEREIEFALNDLAVLRLSLRNPDFTTAQRIAQAINGSLGGAASATDPATVVVQVPANRRRDIVNLMTQIEQLRVVPDQAARVVIDESSGVIVMGENVRISTVAIAQGNLTIRVTETPQVSQPGPFAPQGVIGPNGQVVQGAQTVVVPRTDIQIDDQSNRRLAVLPSGVSLQELVEGLNALGVGPRDMIAILQAIKAAGALQAEIEVM